MMHTTFVKAVYVIFLLALIPSGILAQGETLARLLAR